MTELYTCEELLDKLKNLLDLLQDPSVLVGGSTTHKADDMSRTVATTASKAQAGIMAQIRSWYKVYQDKGCGNIPEIDSLLSNPQIILAGRVRHYNGRVIK
jgi:hypothetical protein